MIQERDAKGRIVKTTGRVQGSKNKRPNIHTVLPPTAVADLYTALFQIALGGDTAAAKLLLDRLDPAPKSRPIELPAVPPVDGIEGAQRAARAVVEEMLSGQVSPDEASALLDVVVKALTTVEIRGWAGLLEQLQQQERNR
jgi:hypothetical protein